MANFIKIPPEYYPEIKKLPGELSWIAEAVEEQLPGYGVHVALIISQSFGGRPVYIHKMKGLPRQIRDDAIRKEADNGVAQKEISARFDLCARQIIYILKQAGKAETVEDQQLKLF